MRAFWLAVALIVVPVSHGAAHHIHGLAWMPTKIPKVSCLASVTARLKQERALPDRGNGPREGEAEEDPLLFPHAGTFSRAPSCRDSQAS